MIIARSPLRISLGGGGTDLPSYYQDHGGFLVAAAIDKYVYVTVHRTFLKHLLIRYSQIETTDQAGSIRHPIIREALKLLEVKDINLEITSMADIPAGTGLGSSGSFTCALLKALYKYNRVIIPPRELADLACHIELDLLREPIGKQDQYIAAFGGVTCFEFSKEGDVGVSPLRLSEETVFRLHDHLMMYCTGFTRSASSILKEQNDRSHQKDASMIDHLHFVKEMGYRSKEALEKGNLETFGRLMDEHWQHKKKRSKNMSNGDIDRWYDLAMNHGALGGKLIGAGGGGFLMFMAEDRRRLREAMAKEGLMELRFQFDYEGTKLLG